MEGCISEEIIILHYPTREEAKEQVMAFPREPAVLDDGEAAKKESRNRGGRYGRDKQRLSTFFVPTLCALSYLLSPLFSTPSPTLRLLSLFLHMGLLNLRDVSSGEGLSDDSLWALSKGKQTLSQHLSYHFFIKHTHPVSLGRRP